MSDLEILFGTKPQNPTKSEKPSVATPAPKVTTSATKKSPQQPTKPAPLPQEEKKPTNPQTRLSTNQSPTLDKSEKVEKYTTHIFPSLIKKVKLEAVEKEINDYDVINNILLAHFDKNK
jgi:hypothetical protein